MRKVVDWQEESSEIAREHNLWYGCLCFHLEVEEMDAEEETKFSRRKFVYSNESCGLN